MMDANLKEKLNRCSTMAEMFSVISSYYDLENTKLGTATKIIVIAGISKSLTILNPPKK